MNKYTIIVLPSAEKDLKDLYKYIKRSDSLDRAKYVCEQIIKAAKTLESYTERGSYAKELVGAGIKEYREIYFKPYRLIYKIINNNVYIAVIADGRRSLRGVLEKRLLS